MTRDSLAFAISGVFFGLLVGWMIGAQQAQRAAPPPASAAATAPDAGTPPPGEPAPGPIDTARANALQQQANAAPSDPAPRIELGNLYFDARRYADAIPWYEAALKLDTRNVNLSTDLGVAYYSVGQVDRALAQFDHSLTLDPRHLKTLLNQGIVRAFGKNDLNGAAQSWERVVAIDPNSDEGRKAQQGLEGIRSAHPNGGAAPAGGGQP
jgi:tetratricopeptide (TPR) repeat protein